MNIKTADNRGIQRITLKYNTNSANKGAKQLNMTKKYQGVKIIEGMLQKGVAL